MGRLEHDFIRPFITIDLSFNSKKSPEQQIPLSEVKILAPSTPSKIVCVGRNYQEHAAELGNKMPEQPLLFLKPTSAIIASEETIRLPPQSIQVEYEGEIGVVIGREASCIPHDVDPMVYVLGLTCVNDVTARDLQRQDVQFTRGKSFDTFCPFGPYIETAFNPSQLLLTTSVNGAIKQKASSGSMAFSIPFLVRYISHIMTLLPGDLIATGTPGGVSKLMDNDLVEVEVEGVGVLRNTVQKPLNV
jgi:2-keto-4-pentenoate hydratase/2-oxohepta-3-ene-1,7-dioic acid hydratase in catechol pathway